MTVKLFYKSDFAKLKKQEFIFENLLKLSDNCIIINVLVIDIYMK